MRKKDNLGGGLEDSANPSEKRKGFARWGK